MVRNKLGGSEKKVEKNYIISFVGNTNEIEQNGYIVQ